MQLTNQASLTAGALAGDQAGARAAEGVKHYVPAFRGIAQRPFDQFHRLHGGMEIIFDRLVDEPDVALVAVAAPIMVSPFLPAIEDRLILALIVRAAQCETVLGPDDESRPMSARLGEGGLERVQFR
jgi:hypothetical protein